MNSEAAHRLSKITNDFYQSVHGSFSSTRQHPWTGWERVAELAFCGDDALDCDGGAESQASDKTSKPFDVLDLACGNLRFARFVATRVKHARVWAVDNCDELVGSFDTASLPEVHYQHVDLVANPDAVEAPSCDLCVSFGFMHHIPMAHQRAAIMRTLVEHARPGGFIAISFWQFEHDERLRAKAVPLEDPGDYLLGWQHETDVRRYCHSYSEAEISALVAGVAPIAREVARFSADGRSGDLNRYVILRVPLGCHPFGTSA